MILTLTLLGFISLFPTDNKTPSSSLKPTNYSIGIIEVQSGSNLKQGLITLVNPKRGITSYHILRESKKGFVKLGEESRKIIKVEKLRQPKSSSNLDDLYSDICSVEWENPFSLKNTPYAIVSTRHPTPDEKVYIPKLVNNSIVWEERFIVGLEGFAVWTNLPKKAYSIILFLNNRPTNKGTQFEEGDSGGAWVSENGEILAITSRVLNKPFSPATQVVYGTLVNPTQAPKNSGRGKNLAVLPLIVTISMVTILSTILLTKKILASQKKIP